MELLLASPRFSIEFDRRHVIAYRRSTFDIQEFAAAVGLAEGILQGLPDYLVQQQRGEA